ncbi:hypothetical protein HDU87_004602 [Geranomyces variabilis]|uniref:Mechanosensitive ion channel MscS domain-containing protein n=1 Tax=Geranomyces variabilis TaxID=109894 RepID=A0AAD5XMB6_9FUNG|nr:hypothetical protein HDU87_004602 [Geranomyces variabilis]
MLITEEWQRVMIPLGAVLAAWIVHLIVFLAMRWAARQTPWPFDDDLVTYSKWPLFMLFPVIAILIALPHLNMSAESYLDVRRGILVVLILGIGFLCTNMVRLGALTILRTHNVESENNLHARIAHTQIQVFTRMCYGFVAIVCLAAIVFLFPLAWTIGASLLASAGMMGIILGIAAKPMVENSLSAFIIAVTQPVLLDDEVIIDGEYGRVESIRSAFIVLRTWDARRLIIPLSRIVSATFENWSRRSPWKIGTAFVYLDASVSIPELRALFMDHVLPTSGGLWDGKVANCAVTDVTNDGYLQVRFLASAKDPSNAFDLRCHIREKIIEGVGKRWPSALCRRRIEVVTDPWPPSMERKEIERKEMMERKDSGKDASHVVRHAAPKEPLLEVPVSVARPLSVDTALTHRATVATSKPAKDFFRGLARGELDGPSGGHGHNGY